MNESPTFSCHDDDDVDSFIRFLSEPDQRIDLPATQNYECELFELEGCHVGLNTTELEQLTGEELSRNFQLFSVHHQNPIKNLKKM